MKRIVTLLLAAGLVFGASSAAKAVDFKVSGYWQFGFDWSNLSGSANQIKGKQGDSFIAGQRFRTQIDVIASENLKGVVQFEIGKTRWGEGDGGSFGSDEVGVKVRYSYVDWVVPQTDLKIRMGLQPLGLPEFVGAGAAVFSTDGAGITASYDVNENVGLTLFWARGFNDNYDGYDDRDENWNYRGVKDIHKSDTLDVVGLTVPVKADGFKVTPWAMYARVGVNTFSGSNENFTTVDPWEVIDLNDSPVYAGLTPLRGAEFWNRKNLDDGDAWWLGFGGEVTLFDPFRVALEFAYGHADFGTVDRGPGYEPDREFEMKRAGWYAALLAEYKLDMMTPGLLFWYASGDDDDPMDGSERMPTMVSSDNSAWAPLSLAYDGTPFTGRSGTQALSPEGSMTGTWGVVAQLKDITFVDNLKHLLRVGYIRGTNDAEAITHGYAVDAAGNVTSLGFGSNLTQPGGYLTEDDWAFEADFITDYQIYENLSLTVDFGYLRVDWDEANWEKAGITDLEKNYYRAGMYLRYSF